MTGQGLGGGAVALDPGTGEREGIEVRPRYLGLPAGAWVALIGLGIVPFVVVVWGHAATFDPGRRPTRSPGGHGRTP